MAKEICDMASKILKKEEIVTKQIKAFLCDQLQVIPNASQLSDGNRGNNNAAS